MMNEIRIDGFRRINKPTARKLYNEGETIRITPCKCRPNNMQGIWADINNECGEYFHRLINAFEYHFSNAELGYYTAYYIKEDK